MKSTKVKIRNDKNSRKLSQYFKLLFIFLVLILLATLTACDKSAIDSNPQVSASWDPDTETLTIKGDAETSSGNVAIHNADTGDLIGTAITNTDGSWSASTTTSACVVHVAIDSGTASTTVENAPTSCSNPSLAGRVADINEIPVGVLVDTNPEALSTIPNAVILSPPNDISVNVGEVVNFSGTAIGTAINPPISYYWNFGGAAANSTVQNPGSILFSRPGTYFISLSVSDNIGIPDPSPAVRTIIVNDAFQPIANTPQPQILSPFVVNGQKDINVGESLFFSGTATDSTGLNAFTYEWNFAGAVPNQFGPSPGNVTFNRAGTYLITLNATNALGIRSTTPAMITVNVSALTAFNQAPDGSIVRPRNDVTINVGEDLNFRASGRDPDNNNPLYYSWDFDGLAPDIFMNTGKSGGNITFNSPGIFRVRLTVTDALGAVDPNPPIRTITVLGSPTQPPVNGTLNNSIISPPIDTTIAPGQSVFFSGLASPLTGNTPVQYFWSFDGAAPNSNLQTPGDITFPIPGQYIVQFYVMGITGNVIGQPETRTITVTDPSIATASLLSPVDGANYNVGTPVNLIGRVDNNSGFTSLRYKWRIRKIGGTTVFRSDQLAPGSYTFTEAGDYRIKFTVSGIDAFGNQTVESVAKSRVTVSGSVIAANTAIAFPASDMFVSAGEFVNFQPTSVVGSNIRYQWNFGGAASPSTQQIPLPVQFNQPGTYVVTLRVTGTDFTGQLINNYGERLITVITPSNPTFPPTFPPTQPPVTGTASPEGFINSPNQSSISVRVGTPVLFSGSGFDPLGTGPLTFIWGFDGAAPKIRSQNPGTVTFNRVGKYVVTLLVQNAFGQFDQTPATVVVDVTP